MIGGDVQVTFVSMGPHIELVRKGVLRVLAAATPKRMPYVPDVPTFAEQGFPGFEAQTWFALFAPRGTSKDILDQLNGHTRGVQADAELGRRLEQAFVDPLPLTQAEFAALVKADAVKWERIVGESAQARLSGACGLIPARRSKIAAIAWTALLHHILIDMRQDVLSNAGQFACTRARRLVAFLGTCLSTKSLNASGKPPIGDTGVIEDRCAAVPVLVGEFGARGGLAELR